MQIAFKIWSIQKRGGSIMHYEHVIRIEDRRPLARNPAETDRDFHQTNLTWRL